MKPSERLAADVLAAGLPGLDPGLGHAFDRAMALRPRVGDPAVERYVADLLQAAFAGQRAPEPPRLLPVP